MQRRAMLRSGLVFSAAGFAPWAFAHHGWSSFDQDRPIYLEGQAAAVKWQNPHVEFALQVPANLALPANLAQRPLPAQSAQIDGPALLSRATLPTRKDRVWQIELAPLTRLQSWRVEQIKPGAPVSLLGYTFKDEKGEPILRAEYLFVDGKSYGLRSGPV